MLWGKVGMPLLLKVRTLVSVNLISIELTAESNQNSIKTKNKKDMKK